MDTAVLVDDKIDAGRKLLQRLDERGFDVAAACWVKSTEDDTWSMYIVSRAVDDGSQTAAYRQVFTEAFAVPGGRLSMFDVKLVGTKEPIGIDILKYQKNFSGMRPTRFWPGRLGSHSVDEAYLYPSPLPESVEGPAGPRMAFSIDYQRQGDPSRWSSTVRKLFVHRRLKALGAVGYTSAAWSGDAPADVDHANIVVFAEIDPKYDDDDLASPGVRRALILQARAMADAMFKARHPDAIIEHVGDDD
jgi:hypothetical protein